MDSQTPLNVSPPFFLTATQPSSASISRFSQQQHSCALDVLSPSSWHSVSLQLLRSTLLPHRHEKGDDDHEANPLLLRKSLPIAEALPGRVTAAAESRTAPKGHRRQGP